MLGGGRERLNPAMPRPMPEPTTISADRSRLALIAQRLALSTVDAAPQDDSADWSYGVDSSYLAAVLDHWRDRYDWSAREAELNLLPQVSAEIDGCAIHAFHIRSEASTGLPILLIHGWPGSPIEFLAAARILVAAGHPVIIPSLPGFAFSGSPSPPAGPAAIADMLAEFMARLGYARFIAQGGDWGASIARLIALRHAPVVAGLHLNMLPPPPFRPGEDERIAKWRAALVPFQRIFGGYFTLQANQPNTIGIALSDSPLGFAAWVIEKIRYWGDQGASCDSPSLDDVLTNIMTYLAFAKVTSAMWLYRTWRDEPFSHGAVSVPTAIARFPKEISAFPDRVLTAELYRIVRWTDMPAGGHFAAWEQPDAFARDVAAFARQL